MNDNGCQSVSILLPFSSPLRLSVCLSIALQVIVEKDNEIVLYCKGSDTKIRERLASSQAEMLNQTDEHLNVTSLSCKASAILFIDVLLLEIRQ